MLNKINQLDHKYSPIPTTTLKMDNKRGEDDARIGDSYSPMTQTGLTPHKTVSKEGKSSRKRLSLQHNSGGHAAVESKEQE